MNRQTETVELPCGETITVQEWTGAEHDDFHSRVEGVEKDGKLFAVAVAMSVIESNGERRYDDNGDADTIYRTWPYRSLDVAWKTISRLNLLTKSAIEAAEKN